MNTTTLNNNPYIQKAIKAKGATYAVTGSVVCFDSSFNYGATMAYDNKLFITNSPLLLEDLNKIAQITKIGAVEYSDVFLRKNLSKKQVEEIRTQHVHYYLAYAHKEYESNVLFDTLYYKTTKEQRDNYSKDFDEIILLYALMNPNTRLDQLQNHINKPERTIYCVYNLMLNGRPKDEWDILMKDLMCLPQELKNDTIQKLKNLIEERPFLYIPDEYKILINCM